MAKKILVIDDEPELVRAITVRFEASGYKAIPAFDGQEGIAKAKKLKPDLILLDIIMPGMDGYEVCRRLKADPDTKNIPVLILTASGQRDLEEKCTSAGGNIVITKPFDTEDLLASVNKFIK